MMTPKEWARALWPVARRIRWCRAAGMAQTALAVAVSAVLLWAGASFAFPIENLAMKMGATALGILIALPASALLWPVSALRAAKVADEMGLEERVRTALTTHTEGAMGDLLCADARQQLNALDIKEKLHPSARRWTLVASGVLALTTALLLMLPNPQQGVLDQMFAFGKQMEKLVDAAAKRERPAAEETDDADAPELRRIERDLLDKLRASRTERAALLALAEAEQQLKRIERDAPANMSKAGGAQDADADSDAKGSSDATEPSEASEQSHAQAPQSSEVSQSQGAASPGGSKASAQAASALLGQLRQGVNAAASGNRRAHSGADSVQGAEQGQGDGAGQGGTKGQGSGQGNDQSAGEGTGGASKGSSDQKLDAGGAMTNHGSPPDDASPSPHSARQYELIYDPERLDTADEVHTAQGQLGTGEIAQAQLGPGEGVLDAGVPYDRVIGSYAPQAMKAADDAAVPPSAREWVRAYFDSLID